MTDIVLVPVTGGNNISAMNNNFDKIEEAINTDILHLKGGNNVMKQDLDLNGHQLLNHETDLNDPDSLINVGDADARYYNVSGDSLSGNMNAAGNKILNLPVANAPHEPMRKNEVDAANAAQDATTAANFGKSLRFPEAVPAMLNAAARANKLQGYDALGNPIPVGVGGGPVTDADQVLWAREALATVTATVQTKFDATPINLWEYASLAIGYGVGAPDTWNWGPALAAFFAACAGKSGEFGPPLTYISSTAQTIPVGANIDFNGATIRFTTGALNVQSDVYLNRPSVDGTNSTNGAAGINLPNGSGRVVLNKPKVRRVHSNAVDNSNGSDDVWIIEPDFDEIGSATSNPTFQANGVFTQNGDRIRIVGGRISRTLGQGGVFVNGGDDISITGVHIHDTKFRAVNLFANPTNVLVGWNKIRRTGELLPGPSAVGSNGIFSIVAAAADAIIIGNDIAKVAENGIEGNGTFINNVIDTTQYRGLTTPSIEGIFLSAMAICRNNVIRNAAGVGIKTFNQLANAKTDISFNDIISPGLAGISVQVDSATGSYAFLNIQSNTIDGANQPGQGGINVIRSNSGTLGADCGVINNQVYGRTTNSIDTNVANRRGNNFDARAVQLTDASATPHQSPKTERYTAIYNTPITSSKTVLVNTTNPSAGDRVRVVRTANATGAFNVNLSTGATLKALGAASTWAEAEYDGANWFLTANGTL